MPPHPNRLPENQCSCVPCRHQTNSSLLPPARSTARQELRENESARGLGVGAVTGASAAAQPAAAAAAVASPLHLPSARSIARPELGEMGLAGRPDGTGVAKASAAVPALPIVGQSRHRLAATAAGAPERGAGEGGGGVAPVVPAAGFVSGIAEGGGGGGAASVATAATGGGTPALKGGRDKSSMNEGEVGSSVPRPGVKEKKCYHLQEFTQS